MNLSHEWLQRFVPHGRPVHAIRDLLTAHVATVEGVEPLRDDLVPFVVGQVIESERIPDTKLSFNKVDDGSGILLDVVCGAPNVVLGAKYPFARTGTTMPAGLVIEKRKIRGFTSNGMLCSAKELGLGEDQDGIMALQTDAAPGVPLLDVLPLGDVRLVVDVLPNRPDLLSHRGIAREVAALVGVAMRTPPELEALAPLPSVIARGDREASVSGLRVRIEDGQGCPQYGAALISGLTVGPSPAWLRAAVEAVGGRSINNLVDATNYLLHGFGQPMHAFDAGALRGETLVVRRARAGETLVTLDGVERKLDPEMLVIADAEHATALAGVMGGRSSEVTADSSRVVLEVAAFDPRRTRTTRRASGLSTDASYRFERGIDEAAIGEMLALGASLLATVGGGKVDALLHVGTPSAVRSSVRLRPARVGRLLGDDVPADEIVRALTAIGFSVRSEGDSLHVTAPSWRHDVSREVDLIEEVARIRGFDRLSDRLAGARPGTVPDHPLYTAYRRVRDAMVAAGLMEVRPLPFTAGASDAAVPSALVRVRNPLGEDEPYLRGSLLDTLARRAEYNLNRMQGNVRLFEVGTAFLQGTGAAPREEHRVGVLVMGLRRPPHFSDAAPPAWDAWDAKAIAERLGEVALPGRTIELEPATAPTLWRIKADGAEVGAVRRVALDAPVWASPAFGIELTLGEMTTAAPAARGANTHAPRAALGAVLGGVPRGVGVLAGAPIRFRALPITPAAMFDLALLVPDDVTAGRVEASLIEAGGAMLERCELFDEFRGAGIPDGQRSLAWRLTFRHPERTLRDKEIEGRRSQLLKTLETQLGVRPRAS